MTRDSPTLALRQRAQWLVLMALAASSVAACDIGSGALVGERLTLDRCRGFDDATTFEPFRWELSFMGNVIDGEVLVLRLSDSPRPPDLVDQLGLSVEGVAAIQREIRDEGVAVRTTAGQGVRLGLTLTARCPGHGTPLMASGGEIRFTELGVRRGQSVSASGAFDLIDARTGQVHGEGFTLDFAFEVGVSTPYQALNNPHQQNPEGF